MHNDKKAKPGTAQQPNWEFPPELFHHFSQYLQLRYLQYADLQPSPHLFRLMIYHQLRMDIIQAHFGQTIYLHGPKLKKLDKGLKWLL